MPFVFLSRGWTNLAWEQQAWKLVKAWPDITSAVGRTRTPTVFTVSNGTLKVDRIAALSEL